MSLFLQFHVAISLAAIAIGLPLCAALVRGHHLPGWAAAFLFLTLLTSLTGFPLPPFGIDPPRIVGIIVLVLVATATAGLAFAARGGGWWKLYIASAVAALYLNVFVAIVQSFLKLPALKALAPTQTEPPFAVAQGAGLLAFVIIGVLALRRSSASRPVATATVGLPA